MDTTIKIILFIILSIVAIVLIIALFEYFFPILVFITFGLAPLKEICGGKF